jgi:hypothetical protein
LELKTSYAWNGNEKYYYRYLVVFLVKISVTSYLAGASVLVYFELKYLTVYTVFAVAIITGLKISAWLKYRKDYKGSKFIAFSRSLLSTIAYMELLLIALKADGLIEIGVLPLMAMIWAILPFCVASCITTIVVLVARLSAACKKERDKTTRLSIPFFIWLFAIFCGGPILIYITVYNLSMQEEYDCTPGLSSLYLAQTTYSIAILVFHLLISSSFK